MRYYVLGIVWFLILWLAVGTWRLRKRRVTIGPAAGATMTALLDDQRRAAIEIILEERTTTQDPEDRDGNLPDLGGPIDFSVAPRLRGDVRFELFRSKGD